MSGASLHCIAGFLLVRGKSILLSTSVGFPTGHVNSAAAVLSCADCHLTVVLRISLLTVYHVYTGEPDTFATATVAMPCTRRTWRGVTLADTKTSVW